MPLSLVEPQCHLVISMGTVRDAFGKQNLLCKYDYKHAQQLPTDIFVPRIKVTVYRMFL